MSPSQSIITSLAVAPHKTRAGVDVILIHRTAGLEPAGSGERHTDGYYAVRMYDCGAWHGRRFALTNEAGARKHFASITVQ